MKIDRVFAKQILENYKETLQRLNSGKLVIHITDRHGKNIANVSGHEIRECNRKIAELEELLK
jgi:hypothetical protein